MQTHSVHIACVCTIAHTHMLYKQVQLLFPTLSIQAHNSETCCWEKGEAAMGRRDKPLSSANEQVRRTAPGAGLHRVTQGHKSRISDPSCAVYWFVDERINASDTFFQLPSCLYRLLLLASLVSPSQKKKKGHSGTVRLTTAVLFNYTNACWASCQGFSF